MTGDGASDGGDEERSERERARAALRSETDYRYSRRGLSASSGDPEAAVAYVREYGVGTRFPARDAVLDLVESTDAPVERFDVLNPDHRDVDERQPAGSVEAWTDRPAVAATASLDADGTVENVRFETQVSRLRVAEAAGLETYALDRRAVDHEVDPDAVPDTFGDDPATTVRTHVYAHDGDDVLVSGDPGAVDDLDPAASLVVYAGALDPATVDVEDVDGEVTVVGADDLDPEAAVADQLGERVGADLDRLVDRFAPDGTEERNGFENGV